MGRDDRIAVNLRSASSLPRATFVGREREFAQLGSRLRSALDEAVGGLVLIAGEPGIGKTRLVSEIAGLARGSGSRVVIGHAYESEGMPAYLPFIEALGECIRGCTNEELRMHVAAAGPDVARLVPDLATRLDGLSPSAAPTPEEERYRLFQSVSTFLTSVAGNSGMVLCVDDLHWADRSSLQLLQHLTRGLPGSRLLILGTYRTVDRSANPALVEMLGILSHERLYDHVLLDPLTRAETSLLIEAFTGHKPHPAAIEAIYRDTNGNAFFVEEVLRHLDSAGAGLASLETGLESLGIPEGVRQALARRLHHLTPDAQRVLQAAAVLGTELDLPVLQVATGLDAAAIADALDESIEAGLLLEDGCRFSHPLIRQTLYDELTLPRRQLVHLQLGTAIEQVYATGLSARLSPLAAHFRLAGSAAPFAKAIQYSTQAGEQASSLYAWHEAAAHYADALVALEASGTDDDVRRCDLLLALGEALVGEGDNARLAADVAPRALALAEKLGDRERAFASCRLVLDSHSSVPQDWLDLGDRYAGDDPQARIAVNLPLSARALHRGQFNQSKALLQQALTLARRAEDAAAELRVASFAFRVGVLEAREEIELFRETRILSRSWSSTIDLAHIGLDAVMLHLQQGEREAADAEGRELEALASRTRHRWAESVAAGANSLFLTMDGRLREAMDATVGTPGTFPRIWRGRLAGWLGDASVIDEEVARTRERVSYLAPQDLAFFLAQIGNRSEACALLASRRELVRPPSAEIMPSGPLAILLEAVALAGFEPGAPAISALVRDEPRLLATPGFVLVPRHRATVAAMVGETDRAIAGYREAIAFCEHIGHRPELAMTRLDLAELLLKSGRDERGEALAQLDRAIPELETMEMAPALARAVHLRSQRKPLAPAKPTLPGGLSEREAEVLKLLSAGRSNQQIADELVISPNTVGHHVRHIFVKTGSSNRTEAAGYAHQHGLT